MAKVFIDGIRADQPPEKAPSFVIAKISINFEKFIESAKEHVSPKGWITLDLLESTKGGYYMALNAWQPMVKPDSIPTSKNEEETIEYPSDEINAEDIPF